MVDFQCKQRYGMADLLEIMAALRSPEGCPWDRAQSHQSIRQNMLEEAYEAADAIDRLDMDNLKEELGDVLLQVVFHARMAQEAGGFTFEDVVDGVCQKLVFRHPHVFGGSTAEDPDSALSAWDQRKREEKGQRSTGDAMDSVARALPALTRAAKLQSKAEKTGCAWLVPPMDKLDEELEELKRALRENSNVEEELGDLLFSAVLAGRSAGVDGEAALHGACEKYIRRFRRVEKLADRPLGEIEPGRLAELWREAKKEPEQ